MTREELLKSKEFWMFQIQNELYSAIEDFREKNGFTRTKLAEYFGVTKGYVTQVLSGNFDHKISKLVELSIACNKVPVLHFVDLEEYLKKDKEGMIYGLWPTVRLENVAVEKKESIKFTNLSNNTTRVQTNYISHE